MKKYFSPTQIEELIQFIKDGQKIQALAYVRNYSPLGLKEALEFVNTLEQEYFPERKRLEADDMGMNAEIIAIGKFNKELIPYLEYDEDIYQNTKEGINITTCICDVITTSQSLLLAEILGIDPWNFNQHELDIHKIDFKRLAHEFDQPIADEIKALHAAHFSIFYRPNG